MIICVTFFFCTAAGELRSSDTRKKYIQLKCERLVACPLDHLPTGKKECAQGKSVFSVHVAFIPTEKLPTRNQYGYIKGNKRIGPLQLGHHMT